METILKLNLQGPSETAQPADLPKTQGEQEPKPIAVGKRLNRMANRAAHKAATAFDRSRSGLFSK